MSSTSTSRSISQYWKDLELREEDFQATTEGPYDFRQGLGTRNVGLGRLTYCHMNN